MCLQLERLRQAHVAYESRKWQVVARRVGHGCTAAECEEKMKEIESLFVY